MVILSDFQDERTISAIDLRKLLCKQRLDLRLQKWLQVVQISP